MLKKIFVLILSANLCGAENKRFEPSSSPNSSMKVIGIGLAALAVYTVLPKVCEGTNAKHVATIGGAALGAYGLTQLWNIGTDLNESMHLNEDMQASIADTRKKYEIMTTKKSLRSCLMENAYKPKNATGIPTECEGLARMYEGAAGGTALGDMITLFKETYKE